MFYLGTWNPLLDIEQPPPATSPTTDEEFVDVRMKDTQAPMVWNKAYYSHSKQQKDFPRRRPQVRSREKPQTDRESGLGPKSGYRVDFRELEAWVRSLKDFNFPRCWKQVANLGAVNFVAQMWRMQGRDRDVKFVKGKILKTDSHFFIIDRIMHFGKL